MDRRPAAAPTASASSDRVRASRRPSSADDGRVGGAEHERPRYEVRVGGDRVARLELPADERPSQLVLDQPLDGPLERPGAERRVGPFADDERPRRRGQLEGQVLARQPPRQVRQQQLHDVLQVASVRAWNTMTSSTRLRNSGRKTDAGASVTSRFIAS